MELDVTIKEYKTEKNKDIISLIISAEEIKSKTLKILKYSSSGRSSATNNYFFPGYTNLGVFVGCLNSYGFESQIDITVPEIYITPSLVGMRLWLEDGVYFKSDLNNTYALYPNRIQEIFNTPAIPRLQKLPDIPYIDDLKLYINTSKRYNTDSYLNYISSPSWKLKSTKFKSQYKGQCQLCLRNVGDTQLYTHHIKYPKNLKNDSEKNWIAICKECHDKLHGLS